MSRAKRIGYLSPMRAAKVQASLRIRAVSPEPPLLAHTSSESRGTFRQKARSLAPLNGWACAVKVCHDGMLEDTNSLDAAHITILPRDLEGMANSVDAELIWVWPVCSCLSYKNLGHYGILIVLFQNAWSQAYHPLWRGIYCLTLNVTGVVMGGRSSRESDSSGKLVLHIATHGWNWKNLKNQNQNKFPFIFNR